jgi:hypothetical protein
MKRRHFLKFTGNFLGALGLSQLQLKQKSLQYGKVLAQNTPRKLALLVGINQYQFPIPPLKGCGTDVYLQRELLIHRFDFNPNDIILVTDDQREYDIISPTRDNILTTFEEHLIKQAQDDDVVVFHYSGHGSQVIDPTDQDGFNSTFVPIDRQDNFNQGKREVSDITGHTLFLLMSAIKSNNFTAVLDSCHSGGGTRGNLTVRSIRNLRGGQDYPSEAELNYQENWSSKLGISPAQFIQLYQDKIAKGVVLAGAKEEQLAVDATFNDFSAGAFSYALTQYLWQSSGDYPLSRVMDNVERATDLIAKFSDQNPLYEVYEDAYKSESVYFLKPKTSASEGFIKNIENNTAKLWLGGYNPQVLIGASKDAVFEVLDNSGEAKGEIKLINRQGLIAECITHNDTNISNIQEGDLVREKAIAIPEDFTLNLGLDVSLDSEKEAITEAIKDLDDRIKIVELGTGEVDYILGKMSSEMVRELEQRQINQSYADLDQIPVVDSIGLYNSALEIIPNSFGEVNETISNLQSRLLIKLRSLLTFKLIKLLFGGQNARTNSSGLQVAVNIDIFNDNQEIVAQLSSTTSDINIIGNIEIQKETSIPLLPIETKTQLQISNQENEDLYIAALVLNPTEELDDYPLFPEQWDAPESACLVRGNETFFVSKEGKKVPQTNNFLTVQEPLGTTEILVVASKEPLRKALLGLQQLKDNSRSASRGLSLITEILDNTRGYRSQDRSLETEQIGSAFVTFKAVSLKP